MYTAYIVDILRTPVGKFGGALSSVRPDDMAALVLREIMVRNPNLDPALIEEVVLGAANQAGEDNRNVARMALLLAGLPQEIGGVTVNRLCASGLQSIMDASRAISCGDGDVYLAGGVESMTRAPFVMGKAETAYSRTAEIYDTTIGWRFINEKLSKLHYPFGMGETAENVAERYGISRETQDEFAHQSQVKYKEAAEQGKFRNEIIPVAIPQRKGDDIIFDTDEHPRLSTVEKLNSLSPAFKKDGSVTAGNSSGINDGAAVSIIVSEEMLKRYNLTPMARVVSAAVAGVDPAHMGIGPVTATQKALKRAGLSINDLDLIELNEAFASQAVACMRELELDPAKVNVNGGSIAIGHPLGASGTRISATLLHEMKRRAEARYGLATMCVGVGQGVAVIYEKV
ncbi:acetyl-CoA C-acyltransferase [Pontibacter akesuensis]|uniref:acetyl-CoA C-acyltransferase n=1 Tax=Pontibacter akesuensis TaxID=388950 RepID=A0A1I7HX58_9BACT|nr:acetyl-CoA C-acyltransferase [Pontibacter akesuensis]GHA63984.1 3-oxoadipyl-CoA thiolase [Pontibacter akesuensis]SFU65273.1 acetyl-CoA C-acetyltransferase [Pontibacter akesuensis]